MAVRASTLILLSFVLHVFFSPADPEPVSRPVGWFKRCRSPSSNSSMAALEVLPGGGWDNLRNLDRARVMDFSYEECQTTEDGFYFVPDDVFVVPWKVTHVQTHAEVFTLWQQHISCTSGSINVEASLNTIFSELHGKFSAEHQRVKNNLVNGKAAMTRVQVRNRIYTVKANPDFRLDPFFVHQVENIAAAITDNHTVLATYLSEKLVAEYGTHVITSVDAGAALVKEDYILSAYVYSSNFSMTSIKASAGYSFLSLFKDDVDVDVSYNHGDQLSYNNKITNSHIEGYGGSPYYPGMSLKEWQASIRNNLVAIDRSGLPLPYVINTNTLPNLNASTVKKVADFVHDAIQLYYDVNTHPGCVDYNSPNFNFTANRDDGSCDGNGTNRIIGAASIWYIWPRETLPFFCPGSGEFQQILLNSVDYFGLACITYWCYYNGTRPNDYNLPLFGGFYGTNLNNAVTNSQSCPPFFRPFDFLVGPGPIFICLADGNDVDAAGRALPFGGFFSCFAANPLTGRRDCPPLFSPTLLTVSKGCHIYYCADQSAAQFRGEQVLSAHQPPFTRYPYRAG